MRIKSRVQNKNNHQKYLKMHRVIRNFLDKKGYFEVEVPVLSPQLIPESYLEVFETEFSYLEKREKLYLTPSPELFLKRLIAQGIGSCYSLTKSFRNSEPSTPHHSPEFTMLEFYKVNADYMDVATELLQMMQYVSKALNGKDSIRYRGKQISLTRWEKISVSEAFQKFAKISPKELFDKDRFREKAQELKYNTEGFTYEDLFSQIYVQSIESKLGVNGYPTLLYDYPKEFAALAKLNKDNKTAQRFEFYICGVELGDCYTELTDSNEQNERFREEHKKRNEYKKINHPIDKGFIDILKEGLPDCAGIAIGFDRLAMVFTNATSIHDLKLIDIV